MLIFQIQWNSDFFLFIFVIFIIQFYFIWDQIWQVFGNGELKGWPLWVNVSGCHMLDTPGSSQLHNGPITGHSWAHQPTWLHLCANMFKKGQNATYAVRKKCEKQPWEHQSQGTRKVRGAAGAEEEILLWITLEQVTTLQPAPWRTTHQSKCLFPEGTVNCWQSLLEQVILTGTVAHGGHTLEQVYPEGLKPMERTYTGARQTGKEEGTAESNCYGLVTTSCSPITPDPFGRG